MPANPPIEEICLNLFDQTQALILAVILITNDGTEERAIVNEQFAMATRQYSGKRFPALLRKMADQFEARTRKKSSPVPKGER